MRIVSVLFAARNSVYKQMEGVEVFDIVRNAKTFLGNTPIVAHPPCRAWSAFLSHQAKPEVGEKELGLWACEQLRKCGGVLEHPAHSRLFGAGNLPIPGNGERGGIWSLEVLQRWWGYPLQKRTWLAFCGVPQRTIEIPYILSSREVPFSSMSKHQRAATCMPFAKFLVSAARSSVLNTQEVF